MNPVVSSATPTFTTPVVPFSPPSIIAPSQQNSQPTYTFSQTGSGTIQVFENGKLISTTTPQSAALNYGYGATSVAPQPPASYVSTPAQQSTHVAPATPNGSPAAGPTYAPGGHAIIPTVPKSTASATNQSTAQSAGPQYFTTPSGAVVNAATGQLVSPPPPGWSSSPGTASAPLNILPAAEQAKTNTSVSAAPSGQSVVAMPGGNPLTNGANSTYYIQSETGARLTAAQIANGSFPSGTFFVSSTGQQLTAQQIANQQTATATGSGSPNAMPGLPNTGFTPNTVAAGNPTQVYSPLPPAGSSGIAGSTPAVVPSRSGNLLPGGSDNALALVVARIGETGQVGENALKALGGESQVYFQTSQGVRIVDQFADGVINEAKTGAQFLTQSARIQIAKDAEIVESGAATAAKWWFFKSPETGQGGPSKPLQEELQKYGIEYEIVE